jgi:transglutaminase-like putative cysteine protease
VNPENLASLAMMIRSQILNDVDDPRTRQLGALIVRKYDVPARDQESLARAVQLYAQSIKFFREFPEVIAAPWVTAEWGIGDCDDKSRMVAAVLKSFRMPVRLVYVTFIKKEGKPPTSHVYPEVQLGGKWRALETVQPWPIGKNAIELMDRKGYKYSSFTTEI